MIAIIHDGREGLLQRLRVIPNNQPGKIPGMVHRTNPAIYNRYRKLVGSIRSPKLVGTGSTSLRVSQSTAQAAEEILDHVSDHPSAEKRDRVAMTKSESSKRYESRKWTVKEDQTLLSLTFDQRTALTHFPLHVSQRLTDFPGLEGRSRAAVLQRLHHFASVGWTSSESVDLADFHGHRNFTNWTPQEIKILRALSNEQKDEILNTRVGLRSDIPGLNHGSRRAVEKKLKTIMAPSKLTI